MCKRQHQGTDPQAAYWPIRQNSQSHQNINKQFYSWIQKINLIDNLTKFTKRRLTFWIITYIKLSYHRFHLNSNQATFCLLKSWCNQFELIWQNVDPSVLRFRISTGKEGSHSLNCVLFGGISFHMVASTQS